MRKHYVLDTNVLIHDPVDAIHSFAEHEVVIPMIVIEELDHLKDHDSVAPDAREVIRRLEELRVGGDISKGVPTRGGGTLRIEPNGATYADLPEWLERRPDNIILAVTRKVQEKVAPANEPAHLVTKDINLRLKADSMGIRAEDYEHDKTVDPSSLYEGILTLPVGQGEVNLLHREGKLSMTGKDAISFGSQRDDMLRSRPNLCCRFTYGTVGDEHSALGIYKANTDSIVLSEKPNARRGRGGAILPRNERQALSFDLCVDESVSLVTLIGKAGTGKTLMACLAGIQQLRKGIYKQILVLRPNEEVGKEMGFLPGTVDEKFAPWALPIQSCFKFAVRGEPNNGSEVTAMLEKGQIQIQPVNFIRGATYSDAYIIVDEGQNLTPHVAKTIITRAGEGSKVVFGGDPTQIDNKYLDSRSNGLVHVVSRFPGQEIYAHLTLVQSERSRLAELAAQLL